MPARTPEQKARRLIVDRAWREKNQERYRSDLRKKRADRLAIPPEKAALLRLAKSEYRKAHIAERKAWIERNRESIREYDRAHYAKMTPASRASYLLYHREKHVRRKYRLTLLAVDRLLKEQSCKCAICGAAFKFENDASDYHVDHDHKTRKVRGLLCFHCNAGIGHFDDSPSQMKSAISYLEATR